MRTLAVAVVLSLASPATLVVTDGGRRHVVEVPDAAAMCAEHVRAQVLTGRTAEAQLFMNGAPARIQIWITRSGDVLLPETTGEWCRLRPELARQIGTGRTPVSSRGPWIAFIAMFGGLAIAIGLVSLWGFGRGPEPKLEPVEDEHH